MMKHSTAFVALWVATCWFGCAHQSRATTVALRQAAHQHVGQVLELRHSSYFGEMYDDNEHWLITPYRFEDVYHRIDLLGRPIHPQVALGTLPAGTRVRIEAIDVPGRMRWLKRMPSGPMDHIWVKVVPLASEPVELPASKRPMFVVLPAPVTHEVELQAAISAVLAPEGEVSDWLASVRPTTRVAIAHKEMVIGMSERELIAAAGTPWRWLDGRGPNGQHAKVAWYPHNEATLFEDRVTEVRVARHAGL